MEILKKVLEVLKKYSWTLLIILFVICLWMWVILGIKDRKINELASQNNIQAVLLDTMVERTNKLGTITTEKEAFQVQLSFLEKKYNTLNARSKELLDKINTLEKKKELIQATNIHQRAVIDSLINNKPIIDIPKGTVTYRDSLYNKDKSVKLRYEFLVRMLDYQLTIRKIEMPNTLYISHKYSSDKTRVLVNVVNSNEYFKTLDIDSYIIPLEPNNSHFKTYLIVGGVGVGVGIITALVFLK